MLYFILSFSDDDYGDLSKVTDDNIRHISTKDVENSVQKCKLQFMHHKSWIQHFDMPHIIYSLKNLDMLGIAMVVAKLANGHDVQIK